MRIESLTHHAMGRATDGSLHARVLPGEEIDTEGRILTPSAHRVRPPCRHYNACGGCAIQHADDAFVADWKEEIVRRALDAQGITAQIRQHHVSPPHSRRRAKLSARRTKKGALVGFHARASDVIAQVPECQILHPALLTLTPALEELTVMLASRRSELSFTVTHSAAGPDLLVLGAPEPDGPTRIALADWAQRHDIARLSLGDEGIVTRNPPAQRFGRAMAVPPPGGFLQATPQGETALCAGLIEALSGAKRIADLFAGAGTFSLPLAEHAEVWAYEGDAALTQACDQAWRQASGLHQLRAITRDLFRNPLLGDELSQFDGIALDPPRAGAAAQIAQLAEHGPAIIGYASCNPVSFARDAARLLAGGYKLEWIDLVDQFRWSPHVELVARFTA